jgi:hypothetical protein
MSSLWYNDITMCWGAAKRGGSRGTLQNGAAKRRVGQMKTLVVVVSIMVLVLAPHCRADTTSGYVKGAHTMKVNGCVKMALHVEAHGTHSCATKSVLTINSFNDIVRNVDSVASGVDAFMVVFDYDSLRVVEYGLTWPAEWGSASTFCCVPNNVTTGTIINPGDGIAIAWTGDPLCRIPNDRPGGNTPPFWVTSYLYFAPTGPGQIVIKDVPAVGLPEVQSCDNESPVYTCVNHVYFGGVLMTLTSLYDGELCSGYCEHPSVEPTTWGSVKSIFR